MKHIWKRIVSAAMAGAMGIMAMGLTACSDTVVLDMENPVITVMLPTFQTVSADEEGPVVEEIERYVAEKMGVPNLEFQLKWAANSNYGEKVTAAMGAGNWPHVMLITERTSTIIQNSRAGNFWDLTDELKATTTNENGETVYKYPNLAETDDMINHNISVDGRVYGLYRAREIGRAGVTVRDDWIDNLHNKGALSFGSDHINDMTLDEFEEMLYAFKDGDPDGDGQDNTYGMVIAGADYIAGPLNNLVVWNGAPNAWGYSEEEGKILPDYMFPEYEEMITRMRKWKADGVINKDMDTFSSTNWDNPFLQSQAGAIIDVADRARRVANNIKDLNPNAVVDVFGFARKSADAEPVTLPTTGYSGYFVLPVASLPTEEHRDFMLKVMDILNDTYVSDLLNYGIVGTSYEEVKNADGSTDIKVDPPTAHYAIIENPDGTKSAIKSTDQERVNEYNDLNQFGMGYVTSEITTYYSTQVAKTVNDVYQTNKLYKLPNYAEAYISPTYSRHSTQLDAIMSSATTKYISGAIDIDAWYAERDRWLDQGGQQVIDEMNEFYEADTDKVTAESIKKDNHKVQFEEGVTQWLTPEEVAEFQQEEALGPEASAQTETPAEEALEEAADAVIDAAGAADAAAQAEKPSDN